MTLTEEISLTLSDLAPGKTVVPCAVFPALIIGVGAHGQHVVDSFRQRLSCLDPRLLSVIETAAILWGKGEIDLVLPDGTSFSTPHGPEPPPLSGPNDPVLGGLQVLCDGVGVHEHLQRLKEEGYSPFGDDADLVIRTYLIGDLHEENISALLPTVQGAVRACLADRGSLQSTCVTVVPDGTPPGPAPRLAGFERIFLTSRVKEHGFLVASSQEMVRAHSLLLEALTVSDAETVLHDMAGDAPLVGTFGAAMLRVGTDEMESWLASSLALRVVQEGYLAPSTVPDSDRAEEVRLDTHLATLWHDLSSPRVTASDDGVGPGLSFPQDAPMMVWCADGIDRRVAGFLPLPSPEVADEETIPSIAPLATLFETLPERMARIHQMLRADMRDWLVSDCLANLPGGLAHADRAVAQWKDVCLRRAGAIMTAEEEREKKEEPPPERWLTSELDRIAEEIRRTGPPQWFSLLVLVTFLTLVGTVIHWIFGGPGLLPLFALAALIVEAIATRPLVQYYRGKVRAKLHHALSKDLAKKIERKLRLLFYDHLRDLVSWLDRTATALAHARSDLTETATRYSTARDGLDTIIDHFLDLIVTLPDTCRHLSFEVALDTLLSDEFVRRAVGQATFPAGKDEAVPDPHSEPLLLSGVHHAAIEQFNHLHSMTLGQVLGQEPDAERRFLERLRGRSLPLHALPEPDPSSRLSASPFPDLIRQNLFLVAPADQEWITPASEHADAPTYLRTVAYANPRAVLYLQIVTEAVAQDPISAAAPV